MLLTNATGGLLDWGPWAKACVLLATTQLTVLTVTLYLHRSQAHRALGFHPALAHFFRFWSWLTTSMVTREWVAIHRKHHAHSETTRDPHSPQVHGIGALLARGTELYVAARAESGLLEKYGVGTPDDWLERHVYTPHCNWGPALLLVVEVALFGIVGVAIWAIQMMWIPFWGAGVVNGLGHWWGYRNFETPDRSGNLFPVAIWIGGEELHNNHHAFPSSAKFSFRRYELDIGWLVIRFLAGLGLATVHRVADTAAEKAPPRAPSKGVVHVALAPRVLVMTAFFRNVTLPALRAESRDGPGVSPRFRRALANGGRWLESGERASLDAWIEGQPVLRRVLEFRARLGVLLKQRKLEAGSQAFFRWVADAERSGIDPLCFFAGGLAARVRERGVPRPGALSTVDNGRRLSNRKRWTAIRVK